jgi:hypothetical protein
MSPADQLDRLTALGLPTLAGLSPAEFRELAAGLRGEGVLCVHPELVPPTRMAAMLAWQGRPGFVVEDMTDLDKFGPIDGLQLPNRPLYLLKDPERGDQYQGRTPTEVLPELDARGRTPLTINEGLSWLLQEPGRLEPGHCFMTIGSRRRTARGVDARTPAIWISRGSGRDGAARRNSPKVGWCWAGNHHTWLGVASAEARSA